MLNSDPMPETSKRTFGSSEFLAWGTLVLSSAALHVDHGEYEKEEGKEKKIRKQSKKLEALRLLIKPY